MSDFELVDLLNPIIINIDGGLNFRGDYDALTDYVVGDVVIDPCAGSGSTLLSAIQLDRRAYGFEIKKNFHKGASRMLNEYCDNYNHAGTHPVTSLGQIKIF